MPQLWGMRSTPLSRTTSPSQSGPGSNGNEVYSITPADPAGVIEYTDFTSAER